MKEVKISELKAKLSYYIRTLRSSGGQILIVDRTRPVALLKDVEWDSSAIVEQASLPMADVLAALPPLSAGAVLSESPDSTAALLRDRERR